jgi:hypothetical protein
MWARKDPAAAKGLFWLLPLTRPCLCVPGHLTHPMVQRGYQMRCRSLVPRVVMAHPLHRTF